MIPTTSLDPQIQDVLATVDALAVAYERLALVVGASGSRRSRILHEAAAERGWPVVNLSLGFEQADAGNDAATAGH